MNTYTDPTEADRLHNAYHRAFEDGPCKRCHPALAKAAAYLEMAARASAQGDMARWTRLVDEAARIERSADSH